MITEYHDENTDEDHLYNKEGSSRQEHHSSQSRWREFIFPVVTTVILLALVISLGVSNTKASDHLLLLEQKVSNLTDTLNTSQQLSKDVLKEVSSLQFDVENNKDQLRSVSEALTALSEVESLKRTVSGLKCSLNNLIHNNTGPGQACCPLDWEQFQSSCYFFSSSSLSWFGARDWCSNHQGHLAILITTEEWRYVTRRVVPHFYWVGLSDQRTGQWEWVNHTPYVMVRRHWLPNQPDKWEGHGLGGTEDCAHIHRDGRLNDYHCTLPLRFICQRHSVRTA